MKNILMGLGLSVIGMTASAQGSLLYKVSGNGLKQPSYVYGTIHMTCDATLDKQTLEAMDKTAQLYLELDLDDSNLQATMMKGMMMKDGKTMKSMVSDDDWKVIDTYMQEKLGMSALMLNNMKPFMLSTIFLPTMLDCPIQSVEGELVKVAKAQQEEVYGLETVDEQMAVFDAIPYDVQMAELVKSIKNNFVSDKEEIRKMMTVYQSKDLDAMLKMINGSDNKITAEHQEELLFKRNSNWIPRMETIAKEKPTFFGVGAGHLPGPKGVLALLRERGYKVDPVQ